MKPSAVIVTLGVLFLNLLIWAGINIPTTPREVRFPVAGLSYNPYQRNQGPFTSGWPTEDDIDRDLSLLSTQTPSIRLYRASLGFDTIVEHAKDYDLDVILTAYLNGIKDHDLPEVEAAIKLAGRNRHVTRLLLGNEALLRQTINRDDLISYLRDARKRLRTPVSTAEPWDFWIENPEFVKEVDFIAIHILPYWKEVPIEHAVDYVLEKYHLVRDAFPYKMVYLAETGWPSDGPQRGGAEATLVNQAGFIREFVQRAESEGIAYNIIEAFDQPWKSALEGRAGEHWGLMDANRQEKFPLVGPVLENPTWRIWAVSSMLITAFIIIVYFLRRPRLSVIGQFFFAGMVQLAVSCAVVLAKQGAGEYMSNGDVFFWTIMVSAQALLAIIFLTDTAEIGDVVGGRPLKRKYLPSQEQPTSNSPMVSLHVACCREPPDLLIATLNSLAALNYTNYEVVVVDNNTFDETLWRPVQKRCEELGPRFRFFTLGKWPGFKAGALNYALSVTDPRAAIVGVVDADYIVDSNWLQATVPYFSDESIAVVQAPQEHRGWNTNMFQMMENDEYSGFFRIGMVQRNEDNAIIQHGTMTLINRRYLDEVKGWAEWCICEDTELGLRLLVHGKRNIYIDHTFGRGLVPDSYEAYAKQRFRWAYGGMRILRGHWAHIIGFKPGLSPRQRYHFLKGWLPWIGDALHMFFTFASLVWTTMLLSNPLYTDFPEPIFIYPALALVLLRLLGTALTYTKRVQIGHERTLLAMVAGGSLTHTIAKAVVLGLFTSGIPFYRTPKLADGMPILKSLLCVYQELFLSALLVAGAIGIVMVFGTANDDALLWAVALVVQAFPYFAAIVASVVSGLSGRSLSTKEALVAKAVEKQIEA